MEIKATDEDVTNAAEAEVSTVARKVENKETVGLDVPTTAGITPAVQEAEDVTNSAVQADVSPAAVPKLPVTTRLELDKVDAAELAAVVLDNVGRGVGREEEGEGEEFVRSV